MTTTRSTAITAVVFIILTGFAMPADYETGDYSVARCLTWSQRQAARRVVRARGEIEVRLVPIWRIRESVSVSFPILGSYLVASLGVGILAQRRESRKAAKHTATDQAQSVQLSDNPRSEIRKDRNERNETATFPPDS